MFPLVVERRWYGTGRDGGGDEGWKERRVCRSWESMEVRRARLLETERERESPVHRCMVYRPFCGYADGAAFNDR